MSLVNTRASHPRSTRALRALSVAAVGVVALVAPLAAAAPASAHSSLIDTSPAADGPDGASVIDALPDRVSLTFSDDLTPPLPTEQQQGGESTTQIRVYDDTCADAGLLIADPGRADTRDCTDYAAGEAVVEGPTVSVDVDNQGAPAGTYTVVWQVVYGDGHPDSQMFTFTAENAVAGAGTPSTSPSAAPSETPSAAPSEPSEASTPDPAETTEPGASEPEASEDPDPSPAIIEGEGPLSTPAVVAIVGGALVLVLIAFIIVMIARSRRS